MQNILHKVPIVLRADWIFHVKFNFISKSCLFASLLRLRNICETCKKGWKRSVSYPKWQCTYMFAHGVVSWTEKQSSCFFSVTIADFPVLDSAIGNWFERFCRFSPNYTYVTYRHFLCQLSVMAEATVKQRAFSFTDFNFQRLGYPASFTSALFLTK